MMLLEHTKMVNVVKTEARRGSILVLVLGILAMMAVFAAVYLSIGIGDQRSARALETKQERQEIAPVVADYIADVIAQDRLATTMRPGSNDAGTIMRAFRENTDYPLVDQTRRSIPGLNGFSGALAEIFRFHPAGTHTEMWPGALPGSPDPRVADDPWLAVSEPTYLGDPLLREVPADTSSWWRDRRDWGQISNFAPDGLFVNLFALRNNFDAERGIQNPDEMSHWLSLVKRTNPGDPAGSQLRATDANSGETHITGLTVPALDMKNTPAFWTMDQRNLFFPIGQGFAMLDPGGNVAGWGSPYFPDYQYADADGDGFADSRWFELKDSTFADINEELSLLTNSGDFRIFVAARAIDLSGRVDVNTASDGGIAPTALTPLGATPGEIDVRRLLTMEDAALSYLSDVGGMAPVPLGYSSIPRPLDAGTAFVEDPGSDYSGYGYEFADPDLGKPVPAWIGWFGYDGLHRAMQVPSYPWSVQVPSVLPTEVRGIVQPSIDNYNAILEMVPTSPFEFAYLLQSEGETVQTTLRDGLNRRALNRAERYLQVGSVSPLEIEGSAFGFEEAPERFGSRLFNLADLSELLTYNNLNDPATFSHLEAAIDGRYEDGQADPLLTTRRFGPLRSGRELAFERDGHDNTSRGSEFGVPTGADGVIDADVLALHAVSPRQRLTTVSGAADQRSLSALTGAPNRYGVRLQDGEAKQYFPDVANNVSSAFSLYRQALAPHSDIDASWDGQSTVNFDRYRTLFYGYGGPELALRAAAHLAVNLRDQYDTDGDTTIGTLVLSNPSGIPLIGPPAGAGITDNDRRNWPGWVSGNRLVPPANHAFNGGPGRIEADAINVYGIEPQPFIVEAMSINVHTDAPNNPGIPGGEPNGDIDFDSALCQPPQPGQPSLQPIEITIGGKLDSGDFMAGDPNLPWELNVDFAMQVFAVKLHNPFNRPVTLGSGASGPPETGAQADDAGPRAFNYYIEFGGRYFKLARYTPPNAVRPNYGLSAVTLNPGETRVFYMLAQEDEEEIVERWSRYINAYGGVGQALGFSDLQNWLNKQFELKGLNANASAVWIRRFNPETGLLDNTVDSADLDPDVPADSSFEDLWSFPSTQFPSTVSGGTPRDPDWQVVRLWKKVTVGEEESRWDNAVNDTDNWLENDQLVDRLREPDPDFFTPPDGNYQAASKRIGYLDSRPLYAGGYDPANLRDRPRVRGTRGCIQSLSTAFMGDDNDNTGWTIAFYSFVRRAGFDDNWSTRDPSDDERMLRGVLPIWCIEAISSKANSNNQTKTLNIKDSNVPTGDLSDSDFDFNQPWAFRRFSQFLNENDPVEESFNQTPNEWDGPRSSEWPKNAADGGNRLKNENRLHDQLYGPVRSSTSPILQGAESIAPELHVRSDKFEVDPGGSQDPIDISRVTDILSPLAIGPEYDPFGDPDEDGGVDDDNDIKLPGRYLTLSEAFALALGFDELDLEDTNADGIAEGDGTPDETVYNRYVFFDASKRNVSDAPGQPATGDWEYAFDRNQLWVDKFVPFDNVDADANPATVPDGLFDPTQGDYRMGFGVTPAMMLLDSVQTLTDGDANTILGRALPGRINVNTASLPTLRTIGMLSPSISRDAYGVPENWAWRLADQSQFGNVTDPSGFDNTPYIDWVGTPSNSAEVGLGMPDFSQMDIAATIAAYRDRARQIEYRFASLPLGLQGPGAAARDTGFIASDGLSDLYLMDPNEESFALNNRADDFGRQNITGIQALREVAGFTSPGELFAAKVRADLDDAYPIATLPFTGKEAAPNQLDYFARDTRQNNPVALETFEKSGAPDNFRVRMEPRGYSDFDPFGSGSYNANRAYYADEIGNDYDEQLVLQSQLMNLVTTRSDLYAVWFIVRGYTEEDVSNLRGDVNSLDDPGADPMTPSLERRYLMVVDRSKVGTWVDFNGDQVMQEESEIVTQPEIVLLRELPN